MVAIVHGVRVIRYANLLRRSTELTDIKLRCYGSGKFNIAGLAVKPVSSQVNVVETFGKREGMIVGCIADVYPVFKPGALLHRGITLTNKVRFADADVV